MRCALLVAAAVVVGSGTGMPPPADEPFDYQIGGDYPPPEGVTVVSRDWFAGEPLPGGYTICYVNAFQTQPDDDAVDRPDERSNWPPDVVLAELGDDPNWEGEYLIDLATVAKRRAATAHVAPMIDTCVDKGFQAVEFDNLDSWTRFDGTALAGDVPFDRDEAIAYAEMLTDDAHAAGLAVGQKNALELGADASRGVIGFDFAVVEECGAYDECTAYADIFGDDLVVIEYTDAGFAAACETIGDRASVVRRDIDVTTPESSTYVYDQC